MKNLLKALGLALAFTCSTANAATFKISTAYPDGTFVVKTLKQAAKEIEAETEGRVKIKFYPGGVQGDKKTVLKKMKRGILSGALLEAGALHNDFKDGQVYNAPMIFQSFEEVDYVRAKMDPELTKGFKEAGWQTFGLIDGGFAYAMTNTPALSIDQLKAQKLWLPANDPLSEKTATALGLSPIYLGLGEVLTGLQTGAINAIVTPPTAALTLQWYSKVKHVTDVPFMYTYGILAMTDKAYKKISPEDQKIVEAKFNEASKLADETARKDSLKAFEALSSQGLTIEKPSTTDVSLLKDQADKATNILVEQGEFSQARLDKLKTLLAEFRAQ